MGQPKKQNYVEEMKYVAEGFVNVFDNVKNAQRKSGNKIDGEKIDKNEKIRSEVLRVSIFSSILKCPEIVD
jgi:uncharacterized protein YeeX (DUF496 family)